MTWALDRTVWESVDHVIGVFGSSETFRKIVSIPAPTTDSGAYTVARISVSADNNLFGAFAASISFVLKYNGQEQVRFSWGAYETGTKTRDVDVLIAIRTGDNTFEVTVSDAGGCVPLGGCRIRFSAFFHLEGAGPTPPDVGSPQSDLFNDIWNAVKPWVPIAAVGGALLFVAFLAAPEIQRGIRAARGFVGGALGPEGPPPPPAQPPIIVVR